MNVERPSLDENINSEDLRSYYYLKEELQQFCERLGLSKAGGKDELIERICGHFGGNIVKKKTKRKNHQSPSSVDDVIMENVAFSEDLREFFKREIDEKFKFNVIFCNWLRDNPGKTYSEAIAEYPKTLNVTNKPIGKQFKYNTYIRDFFADNPKMQLNDAIICWNEKKKTSSQKYERDDLKFLQ